MNEPRRLLDALELPDQLRRDLTQAHRQERYETSRGLVHFLSLTAAIDLPSQATLHSLPQSALPDPISSLPPMQAPPSITTPTAVLPPPAAVPAALPTSAALPSSVLPTSALLPSAAKTAWSIKALAMAVGQGSYWGVGGVGAAATLLTATSLLAPTHLVPPARALVAQVAPEEDPGRATPALQGSNRPPSDSRPSTDDSSEDSRPPSDSRPSTQHTKLPTSDVGARAEPTLYLDDLPTAEDPASTPAQNAPSTQPHRRKSALSAPPSSRTSQSDDAPGGLAEEVHELKSFRRMLDSAPAELLTRIQSSGFSGRGALEPERQALTIEALLRLGRTQEAQRRAATFIEIYPNSPAARRWRCEWTPSDATCPER